MILRILFIALLLAPPTWAANHYLDNAAAGANNGTSWANAWTSPASITAAAIAPGDTIWVSGGTVSKTYDVPFSFPESGTAGNPITFKNGQEAGHNGIAIFPMINPNTFRFTIIDGARDPAFVPPTNVWDIAQITNNIGLRTMNTTNVGIFFNGAGGENNTVRWVEVGPHGNTNEIPDVDIHGIRLLNMTTVTNLLVEYCYIHNIRNDGINYNSSTVNPEYWDALRIRWCWVDDTGDDAAQNSRNGFTMDNCMLSDHWVGVYQGHPDQLQFSGDASRYLKVVNCIMRNKANSLIISEFLVTEGGTMGPMLYAGNIFYNTRDWYFKETQAYGATLDAWRPNADTNVNVATWTNLYFLNNTIYYQRTIPIKVGRANPVTTRSVWNLYITNSEIRNNLFVDNGYNSSGPIPLSVEGATSATNGLHYDAVGLPMTHNIVAGPNTRVSWGGTIYNTAEAFNAATGFTGNTSEMPTLTSTNDYDFSLSSNDTVARDRGYDLSALTNRFPELMVDLTGKVRGQGAGWDIGAMEFADPSLIVHLRFEDDLMDGIADDSSGNGNHGLRYGRLASPTNWPTSMVWTNPITGATNASAKFLQYTNDGWSLYGRSGDYIVITNITDGGLQSMTQATVMIWVNRGIAPDHDGDGNHEWSEDQGRYVSAGYAYSGAWTMGMFSDVGAQFSYLRVYTNNSAAADTYIPFGAGTRVVTSGNVSEGIFTNTTRWVHLAFTWADGLVKTYEGGVLVSSNQLPITAMTVRGPAGGLSNGSIMLGVDTHNGLPNMTPNDDSGEQYPNHAWFNGQQEDFRIYNRVLTEAEIQTLIGIEQDDPPPEEGGPAGTVAGVGVVFSNGVIAR